jgi:hypothetical protein
MPSSDTLGYSLADKYNSSPMRFSAAPSRKIIDEAKANQTMANSEWRKIDHR